ncbi:MAG: diguanylate cyclase [bacterium]
MMFNREHTCEWRERTESLERELAQLTEGAAYVDPITGVGNFKLLGVEYAKLLGRWNRQREPFSLVLMAVTEARALGQGFPERAFAHVARILGETVRAEDTLCRASDNEYAVLLANSTAEGGEAFLERARNRIAQEPIRTNDGSRFYRSAAGVAQWDDTLGSLNGLLRAADARMQLFFEDMATDERAFLPSF